MKRKDILASINNLALKLLQPLGIHELYKLIILEFLNIVGGKEGRIVLYKEGVLRTVYSTANYSKSFEVRKKGYTYQVFKQKKILLFEPQEAEKYHPQLKGTEVKAILMIPLSYKETSLGVIVLRSHKGKQEFLPYNEDALKLLGSMASLAIKKAELYEELTKAIELRDFFIALATQELRTPLTTITGYIHLLQKKLEEKNLPEAKWADKLFHENERLKNLVEELLAVNRIKAGQFAYSFEECNINVIIAEALNNFNALHPAKNLRYKKNISDNTEIVADGDKLRQVINRLLENAEKFSPKNTPVDLITEEDEEWVFIHIRDHGKGIEEKDIPQIFHGFYKPNYQQEHGFGVGLYLAQSIIERHNGIISISSREREGTTVTIKLPI